MRHIHLTQGKTALVSDRDFLWISKWKWRAQRARKGSEKFYAARGGPTQNGKRTVVWMHREILGEKLNSGLKPDHRDGDGLNNLRSNLRVVTHRQNCQNKFQPTSNKSGFKGVSWKKRNRRWCAQIKTDARVLHLGLFTCPKTAARAYDNAAKKHFGSCALTNKQLGLL